MTSLSQMFERFVGPVSRIALVIASTSLLTACQDGVNGKAFRPIPSETLALMEQKGTTRQAPMLIRAYKKEAELEIWKMKGNGEYALLKSFPMCRWSGQLGPKRREGDRQVPEGFYTITPGQMNPNSNYYLSFNVGYPNALDRAQGYTGGSIMVHGACSSAGCFSMTDQQIEEIYAIARESFAGGQRAIQMQSLPFRMTPENLARHRLDPNMAFWKQLKEGSDRFDVTKREPSVGFCGRRYVFDAKSGQTLDASSACPPLNQDASVSALVAQKEKADESRVAELVASGVQPVKIVYSDGGQHPSMASVMEVSRPDALAQGPVEIALDGKGRPLPPLVQMAKAPETKVQDAKAPEVKTAEVKSADAKETETRKGEATGKTVAAAKPAPAAKAASGVKPGPVAAKGKPETPETTSVAHAEPEKPSGIKRLLNVGSFGLLGSDDEATRKAEVPQAPAPAAKPSPRASAVGGKPQASLNVLASPVRVASKTPAE